MFEKNKIKEIASARLKDSEILFESDRYDGMAYLSGYAIELALKYRICESLNWKEYPTSKEYQSYKTHNLETLLHLSGIETKIKNNFLSEWSIIKDWNPEFRYKPIGSVSQEEAGKLIKYVKTLLEALL